MSKSSCRFRVRQTESLEDLPNSARVQKHRQLKEGMEQMAEVMGQMAEMMRTNQQIQQQMIRMADRPRNNLNPSPKVKLQSYNEGDDMETFLETFEASMKLNKVDERLWLTYLIGLLRGKTAEACQGIDHNKADYAYVRERLRDYFDVTEEGQRKKVRSLCLRPKTSPESYTAEGTKLVRRWLKPKEEVEEVLDKILREALIEGLLAEMRQWVGEH